MIVEQATHGGDDQHFGNFVARVSDGVLLGRVEMHRSPRAERVGVAFDGVDDLPGEHIGKLCAFVGDELGLVAHRHGHLHRVDQVAGEVAGQALVDQRLAADGIPHALALVGVGLGLGGLVEQGVERNAQGICDSRQRRDGHASEVTLRLGQEAGCEACFSGDLVQGLVGGATVAAQPFPDLFCGHWRGSCSERRQYSGQRIAEKTFRLIEIKSH